MCFHQEDNTIHLQYIHLKMFSRCFWFRMYLKMFFFYMSSDVCTDQVSQIMLKTVFFISIVCCRVIYTKVITVIWWLCQGNWSFNSKMVLNSHSCHTECCNFSHSFKKNNYTIYSVFRVCNTIFSLQEMPHVLIAILLQPSLPCSAHCHYEYCTQMWNIISVQCLW